MTAPGGTAPLTVVDEILPLRVTPARSLLDYLLQSCQGRCNLPDLRQTATKLPQHFSAERPAVELRRVDVAAVEADFGVHEIIQPAARLIRLMAEGVEQIILPVQHRLRRHTGQQSAAAQKLPV